MFNKTNFFNNSETYPEIYDVDEDVVDGSYLDKEYSGPINPNVLDESRFKNRTAQVFEEIANILANSYGPGGAGTFISIYPANYSTKDGYTIMKNIAFDKKIDQIISDLILQVCTKLNFAVGDGTTTAIIATQKMYETFLEASRDKTNPIAGVLPRKFIRDLSAIKDVLIDKLAESATPIDTTDPMKLRKTIYDIVSVSSNGDEDISNTIADLYKELNRPSITYKLAKDGITKSYITEGFELDVILTDKMYINNDDNTCNLNTTDVVVFDHKITADTFAYILAPLSEACAERGRKLICIAPYYDEKALTNMIAPALKHEFETKRDINLVLTAVKNVTAAQRNRIVDLTMLLNTSTITEDMEKDMVEFVKKNGAGSVIGIFNIDFRNIEGISVPILKKQGGDQLSFSLVEYKNGLYDNETPLDYSKITGKTDTDDLKKLRTRLGYAGVVSLGLKKSLFSDFRYDEEVYKKFVNDASHQYEEVKNKCGVNGIFSLELTETMERLYALQLKTGVIEIGGSSEMSQNYLRDVIDDSVKAAASAFYHGTVQGCGVTLFRTISELEKEIKTDSSVSDKERSYLLFLLYMIKSSYTEVFYTVYGNVFDSAIIASYNKTDIDLNEPWDDIEVALRKATGIDDVCVPLTMRNIDVLKEELGDCKNPNLIDIMKALCVGNNVVFDLSTGKFETTVINSVQTDQEILSAAIDLIGLLVTGNQLVVR